MPLVRRRFETTDLDQAVEVFTQAFTGGGLRLSDFDDFAYRQDFVGTGELAAVDQSMAAEVVSRSDESDTLFLAWTERGATEYRMGLRELSADAGLLWSGRRPVEAAVHSATVGSITFDRGRFESRARALLGYEQFVLPDFAPLPSRDHVDLARRHYQALRNSYLDERLTENPLAWSIATDLTVAVVLAATGLDDPLGGLGRVPMNIRRALAFIDDNLDRPISLGDIAIASGLSARGLQAAFRRATGESPMERLRRARLARVRAELAAADPAATTVASVARRWGFVHLGRFSVAYRREFGESPSETLRH